VTAGAKLISFRNATVEKAYVDKDGGAYFGGNVGVGTASPTAKLHIVSGTNVFKFNDGGSSITPNISVESTTGKAAALITGTNGAGFVFDSSGTFSISGDTHANIAGGSTSGGSAYMTFSSGNVGIGTTIPANTLDIGNSGGIHITAGVPTSTAAALYNSAGVLSWNGAPVSGGGTVTGVTGTAPVTVTGTTARIVSMAAATTSVPGYLLAADWAIFNGKANGGANSNITSLSGLTTALSLAQGGTGAVLAPAGAGALPYFSSATAMGVLAAGTSGQYVKSAGAAAPTWGNFAADVIIAPITGLTSGAGSITNADTVLTAMNKLAFVNSDYVSKTGASTISGTFNFTNPTSFLYAQTPSGTTATEVANVQYVANAISSNGVWNKSGSTINYTAGNVGIGTTNPLEKLEISSGNIIVKNNSLKQFQWQYDAAQPVWSLGGGNYFNVKSGNTTYMFVDSGGNVGIGTTAPTSLLHTVSAAAKTASYTGRLHMVSDTSSTASVNKIGMDIESTGTWNGSSAINTGLVVNATGGTTNYAATFNGGNVGIGTTAPAAKLDVAGDASINGATVGLGGGSIGTNVAVGNRALWVNTTGGQNTALGKASLYSNTTGGNNTSVGTGSMQGNTTGSSNIALGTNAGNAITTGSNNVIIGSSTGSSIATLSNYILLADGSGNERLRVDNNGNVGIGTTAPSSTLQISKTDTSTSGTALPGLQITPTYNQTSIAAATDLLINRIQTAIGSGLQRLLDAQVGGVSKFSVDNAGNVTAAGSINLGGAVSVANGGTAGTGATNAQTSTSYTTILGDAGNLITMNNASASTLTIPPNSSVAYSLGTVLCVQQIGAGAVTLTQGGGVIFTSTCSAPSAPVFYAQNALMCAMQTSANTWAITGNCL
jgi:hypothetical protein